MMKSSQFLTIAAIIAFVFGLLMVIVPGPFLAAYGNMDPGPMIGMARGWGASLLGVGVIAWGAKDASGPAVDAVLLGIFVSALVGGANTLWGVLGGMMGNMGWLSVAVQAFLLVGSGMCRFGGAGDSGSDNPNSAM